MSLYFRIASYIRPYWTTFAVAVSAMFLYAFFDIFSIALFIPFLRALFNPGSAGQTGDSRVDEVLTDILSRFVDLSGAPEAAVRGIIVFMLVAFALKNIFGFLSSYLVAWLDQSLSRDLRRQVYNHLLDLDLGFFGRTKMGQIVSRLTHDI